jgi:aryl-alcohol dehydrogenase-like predicted oxidoreductase
MTAADIERRALGADTGLRVTAMGIGLWAVAGSEWGAHDDRATLAAIDAALAAGVNFFDTADKYGDGKSEELLGRALAGRREEVVIATKIGWNDFDRDAGRSRYDSIEKVREDVEGSLRRLRTDVIDVLQCHIDFDEPNTPVMLDAFRALKAEGVIRAWGISTGDLARLEQFKGCDTLQVDYSILNRTPERDLLPYCVEEGIGVIVRGPIAMGLLADKFSPDDTFAEDDFRHEWTTDPAQRQQFLADLEVVEQLRDVVPEGQTMADFALRFALSHPAVATVIPGAKNAGQAQRNSAAGTLPLLSDDERRAVDAIVVPGGGRKIWPA